MTARGLALSGLWSLIFTLCWPSVSTALKLGLHDERQLPVIVAPFLFAILIYWERNRIFVQESWNVRMGAPLLALALLAGFFLRRLSAGVALALFAAILACMAAFLMCYGSQSFVAAIFPLCCLFLMIPTPGPAMDQFNSVLQRGSAALSCQMMRLVGIPVFARGTQLSLPGLNIDVEPECSGIHSCLALGLVGLLASRIFLRSNWNRAALAVSTIPIAILKNAFRISLIASVTAYVNPKFIDSPIHHKGGLVFASLGVIVFLAFLTVLQRLEKSNGKGWKSAGLPQDVAVIKAS